MHACVSYIAKHIGAQLVFAYGKHAEERNHKIRSIIPLLRTSS